LFPFTPLRYPLPGIEKMYNSMSTYVKSLSKRTEGEGKEKVIPIAYLGTTMSRHGEAFEDGNRFGDALLGMHCSDDHAHDTG